MLIFSKSKCFNTKIYDKKLFINVLYYLDKL